MTARTADDTHYVENMGGRLELSSQHFSKRLLRCIWCGVNSSSCFVMSCE